MSNTASARPTLFRPESLRGRELAWQGRPALALGLPAAFTSLASVALAAATVALITFGGYTRRVDMEGAVLPSTGVIDITAPSPGRIATLAVREGDIIKKDAPLYTMDVDTTTKDGGAQQQIIDAQLAERDSITREVERKLRMSEDAGKELRQKIETLKSQINQYTDQITFQQAFVKKVTNDYNQFAALVERRIVPVNELNVRQQTWMQAITRFQDLENSKARLETDLKDAEYQVANTAHTRSDEVDALKGKLLEINEKLANSEAHRSVEIRAPEDGVVTDVVGHPGQSIGNGAPLLKIVPQHAPLQAELLAPSSAIGFIHEGGRVLLRYSAFPYQKFGEYWGTIVTVSRAPVSAEEVKLLLAGAAPSKQTSPFYRIVVKPDSQNVTIYEEIHSLPAGMQVQAYALLDRRRIYEWILNPLYDIGRATRDL